MIKKNKQKNYKNNMLTWFLVPILVVAKQFTVTTTQFFANQMETYSIGHPCRVLTTSSSPIELVEEGTRHVVKFNNAEAEESNSQCRVVTMTLNGRRIYGNHGHFDQPESYDEQLIVYVEFLVDRDILLELFVCPYNTDDIGGIDCSTGTTDVMNLPRPPPGNPRYDYSTVTCPKVKHCINPPPNSYTRKSEEEPFNDHKIYYKGDSVTLESPYSGKGHFVAKVETIAGIYPDHNEEYWTLLTQEWEYDWRPGNYARDRVVWHRLARWRSEYTTHAEPGTEDQYGSWRMLGTVTTFTATTEVRGDQECVPNLVSPLNGVFTSNEVVLFSAKTESSCTIRSYSIQGVEYPAASGKSSFETSLSITTNLIAVVDFVRSVQQHVVTTVLQGDEECMKSADASPVDMNYYHGTEATFSVSTGSSSSSICTIFSFSIDGAPVEEARNQSSFEKTVTVHQDMTAVAVLHVVANSVKFSINSASTCSGVASPAEEVFVVDGTVVEFRATTESLDCYIHSFVVAGSAYPDAEDKKDATVIAVVSEDVVGSVLFLRKFQVKIDVDANSECNGEVSTPSTGWYYKPVTTSYSIRAEKLCYIESFHINGIIQSKAEGLDLFSTGDFVTNTDTHATIMFKRSYYVVRTIAHPSSDMWCVNKFPAQRWPYFGPSLQYVASGQEAGVYHQAMNPFHSETCTIFKAWINGIEHTSDTFPLFQKRLIYNFIPSGDTTVELLVLLSE